MNDPVQRVYDALKCGELTVTELSARKLGKFLGKTTSVIYHHWGSVDGLLYEVAQRGFIELLTFIAQAGHELTDSGQAYVAFGLDNQVIYGLMFNRIYDWQALRERGAFSASQGGSGLWQATGMRLAELGSTNPEEDTRLWFAFLHGTVSLAISERANFESLSTSDRDMALGLARTFATRFFDSKENRL